MLNGKFFTGLPPKMIDRGERDHARNRLESHFFWPDDTKVETAAEVKLKRRASFQAEPTARPHLQAHLSLDLGASEVDTKQRFRKEFAKSSIQFFDNIQEEDNLRSQQQTRTPLRRGRYMKQDIATKPTAMRLELPERALDEDYAATKKQQAFNSKIEFYDYLDGDESHIRNNVRKPKMDMNNKKEVERNTKNSPKLQIKHDVRQLSRDEVARRNDWSRDQYTPERSFEVNDFEQHRKGTTTQKMIRNPVFEKGRHNDERRYEDDYRQQSPQRQLRNNNNNNNSKRNEEFEYEYQGEKAFQDHYIDNERHERNTPKKILKHTIGRDRIRNDFIDNSEYDARRDLEQLEEDMRNVRVRASPKKHVSYRDELYENEHEERFFNNDDDPNFGSVEPRVNSIAKSTHSRTKTQTLPNKGTGSNQRQRQQQQQQQQQRQRQQEQFTPDYYEQNNEVLEQFMETGSEAVRIPINLNKNLNNHKLNNRQQSATPATPPTPPTPRKVTPKRSATATKPTNNNNNNAADTESTAADIQKHLRSSICFYDGVNIVTASPPTSSSNGQQRRNARSSATQRVSVGLPD